MNNWTHDSKAVAFGEMVVVEAETHRPAIFNDAVGDRLHEPAPAIGPKKHAAEVAQEAHANMKAVAHEADSHLNDAQHERLKAHADAAWAKSGYVGKAKQMSWDKVVQKTFNKGLSDYSSWSMALNQYLLKKSSPDHTSREHLDNMHKEVQKGLDSVKHPLEEHVHVYSGTGEFKGGIAVGKVVHTPTYTSTSLDGFIAKRFGTAGADGDTHNAPHHVLHFELPKGYNRGGYIHSHSEHEREREFLLEPDQHWKVTNHEVVHTHSANIADGGVKKERHIWTLVPHEHNVNEATYHDPHVFKYVYHVGLAAKLYGPKAENKIKAGNAALKLHQEVKAARMVMSDNVEQHHDTLLADQKKHLSGTDILEKHHNHIYDYTVTSTRVNKHLVNKHVDKNYNIHSNADYEHLDERAHSISKSIQELAHPLNDTAHMYSGVRGMDLESHFKNNNGVIHTPAFTSTSIDPSTSTGFAGAATTSSGDPVRTRHGTDAEHVIHFELPKGYNKGAYIGTRSAHAAEKEYLLDKGQKWKLKSHKLQTSNQYTSDDNDGKYHRLSHTHIWTVVPHDDNIHEMTYHEPDEIHAAHLGYVKTGDANPPGYANMMADIDKQHDRLSNHFAPHLQDLSEHVAEYTDTSKELNRRLIQKQRLGPRNMAIHNGFKEFFNKKVELPETVHAYSGMKDFDPAEHFKAHDGVIHTPAYVSSSLNPVIGHSFAKRTGVSYTEHVLHFELPKGYNKSAYVADHSWAPHEHELIIDHDQKWKLTNHSIKERPAPFGSGATITTHTWSVKPHDEENVHETTYHNPHFFKERHRSSQVYITNPKDDSRSHSSFVEKVNYPRLNKIHAHADADAAQQHRDLSKHYFPEGAPDPFGHDLGTAAPLREYSSGSTELNQNILNKHGGGFDKLGKNKPFEVYPDSEPHLTKQADRTSEAIAHHSKPLPSETHVYSGINFDMHKVAAQGNTVHMPAFTSTSINPRKAQGFAAWNPKHTDMNSIGKQRRSHDKHILHFKLPKGYNKGVYIAPVSGYANERELLLDKGQTWKITGHKQVTSSRGSTTNFDSEVNNRRDTTHTHIWTLEPHKENVHEMYSHSKHFFTHPPREGLSPGGDYTPASNKSQKARSSLKVQLNNEPTTHQQDLIAHDKTAKEDSNPSIPHYASSIGSKSINGGLIFKHTGHQISKEFLPKDKQGYTEEYHGMHVKNLVDWINKGPGLEKEGHFYSGTNGWLADKHLKEGSIVHTPAFTSASTDPWIARSFSEGSGSGRHVLHFHLPAGYKGGRHLGATNITSDIEREFLIKPDQKWKVTKKETAVRKHAYGMGRDPTPDTGKVHIWTLEPHTEETPK